MVEAVIKRLCGDSQASVYAMLLCILTDRGAHYRGTQLGIQRAWHPSILPQKHCSSLPGSKSLDSKQSVTGLIVLCWLRWLRCFVAAVPCNVNSLSREPTCLSINRHNNEPLNPTHQPPNSSVPSTAGQSIYTNHFVRGLGARQTFQWRLPLLGQHCPRRREEATAMLMHRIVTSNTRGYQPRIQGQGQDQGVSAVRRARDQSIM